MRCAGCGAWLEGETVIAGQNHCDECMKAAQPRRYEDPGFWAFLAFEIWMNRQQMPAIAQEELSDKQLMAVLQACSKMSLAKTHYDMVVIAMRAYGEAIKPKKEA